MKKYNFVIAAFALVFGLGILFISLLVVEPSLSLRSQTELSRRHLYLKGEILPDHLAYPFLMMNDRLRLVFAAPDKKIELQLAYAWQRLESSRQLLAKERPHLALETLNKSHHYWLAARQALSQIEAPVGSAAAEFRNHLRTEAAAYVPALLELRNEFTQPPQRELLDKLIEECQAS